MQKQNDKQQVIVEFTPKRYVSYCDYFFATKLTITLFNPQKTPLRLTLKITGEELIIPFERAVELPAQSTAEVQAEGVFSPAFLLRVQKQTKCAVLAEAFMNKQKIAGCAAEITALPYGVWEGLEGDAERLCAYVNPQNPDCEKVVSSLQKGENTPFLPALFQAIKRAGIRKKTCESLSMPAFAAAEGIFLRKECTPLALAVFAAGCMERAGLFPVLAVGEHAVGVGAWQNKNSFPSSVFDDCAAVKEHCGAGGDLLLFDIESAFSSNKHSFEIACKRFEKKLKAGAFECFVDVNKSRASSPAPSVLLGQTAREKRRSREGVWEGQLFDFSARNALVDFKKRGALEFDFSQAEGLFSSLRAGEERELSCTDERLKIARSLYKKSREVQEETGASALCVAAGLLQYGGRERRCSPVLLLPVTLRHERGSNGYFLSAAGESFFNFTLLEILKREFRINTEGLNEGAAPLEAINKLRALCAGRKDWQVRKECYLSLFTFQNFALWRDLKDNWNAWKGNPLVSALYREKPFPKGSGLPHALLTPLSADSYQKGAVALAAAGESFVLHGPPGTGKSQTIANIIAGALYSGKRVLFVCEKQAALQVVKKRLDEMGIGEFCFFFQEKTNTAKAQEFFGRVLSLEGEEAPPIPQEKLAAAEEAFVRSQRAMFEKCAAGFSPFEAICKALEEDGAPALPLPERAFFTALDAEKLRRCRALTIAAASASDGLKSIRGAPFENVNLTACTKENIDGVRFSCENVLAEARHVKDYLSLLLSLFGQKIFCVTEQKLCALSALLKELFKEPLRRYFIGVDGEELAAFFRANEKLDHLLSYYEKHFKVLVRLENYAEILALLQAENYGHAAVKGALKRLERAALHPLKKEDAPKFLSVLCEIFSCLKSIKTNTPFCKNFCYKDGRIAFKKREEFLLPLKNLNEKCAAIFSDYNADFLLKGCVRAANGCTMPVFEGFFSAKAGFERAVANFTKATAAKGDLSAGEDVFACYSRKAAGILDNLDFLMFRCDLRRAEEELIALGLPAVAEALENGTLNKENAASSFDRAVSRAFFTFQEEENASLSLLAGKREEATLSLIAAQQEYGAAVKKAVRAKLISRLPKEEEAAPLLHAKERNLRTLIGEEFALFQRVAPCLFLSPSAVAKFLPPREGSYDLAVFDEASQLPAAEAVGALARARQVIIAGDDKQLPPTGFFRAEGGKEESVLDAALLSGIRRRQLLWHYRSRHESLIAFSNAAYYEGRLHTLPSPDGAKSRVKLITCDGVYERGGAKCNRREAEAVVSEAVRRLKDPALSRQSMGIVTFSLAQEEYIEELLQQELRRNNLLSAAFDREEPLFVKNLENVQGDERDVILFSVCYAADERKKLSLNFGPLNREGGWRRLNVALSRSREEMLVFSSLPSSAVNLSRTSSKGAADFKAFLTFAETGKLPACSHAQAGGNAFAKRLAGEISSLGYRCETGVGVSAFRVDVAVHSPKEEKYLLGILTDGEGDAVDRAALLPALLSRAGWKIISVSALDYFHNPKRELKKIKQALDRLAGEETKRLRRYERGYRAVRATGGETEAFLLDGANDSEIVARLKRIVDREEPISRAFLKKRCLATFGIAWCGERAQNKLDALISRCNFACERVLGREYFYLRPAAVLPVKYRTERRTPLRCSEEDFTPFETLALIRGTLEEKVSVYLDELTALIAKEYRVRETDAFQAFVRACVGLGEQKGLFARSFSDAIFLA